MIIPFHVALPTTTNTPQQLLSSVDNLILASMVSGSSNTLGMFGLGALPTGPYYITRMKFSTDTGGQPLLFGLWSLAATTFYEIQRFYETGTHYVNTDYDFTPRSVTTTMTDWILVNQSNGYQAAFKWGTTPTGTAVNVSGEVQIAPVNLNIANAVASIIT